MSNLDEAISRITAWIRDYGDQKTPVFIADLTEVMFAAKNCKQYRERFEALERSTAEASEKAREI